MNDLTKGFSITEKGLGVDMETDRPWRELKWFTKDGQFIKVKDMTNSHVENACRFLKGQIAHSLEAASRLQFLDDELEVHEASAYLVAGVTSSVRQAISLSAWTCIFDMEIQHRQQCDIVIV